MKTTIFAFLIVLGVVTVAQGMILRSIRSTDCSTPCPCPYNYNPICGTNGRTYDNNCLFRCDQGCDQRLRMAHNGECEGDKGFTVAYEDQH